MKKIWKAKSSFVLICVPEANHEMKGRVPKSEKGYYFPVKSSHIAQKIMFSIKIFFSKCAQIRSIRGFGHIH